MDGYYKSIDKIPVKRIIYHDFFEKQEYIIIYEYEDNIGKNKGLLNDLLVKYDNKKKLSKPIQKIDKILSIYNKNLKDIKILSHSENDKFFKERIESRLKKWYVNDENFSKKIYINNNICKSVNQIIDETIKYFETEKKQKCFFTQGDPNTLNIALSPCFFDLVTAGYNSVIGEFAITFISVLIYDNYFCPKYHSKSYFLHEKAIETYNLFKPKIEVTSADNIHINCNFRSSNIRKEYLLRYIKILNENKIYIGNNIKYYIVMRLLCVFDIEKMEYDDYFYSIFLVEYFYYLFNDKSSNALSILEKMLIELEML